MNEKYQYDYSIFILNSNLFMRPTIHSILILSGVRVSQQICY